MIREDRELLAELARLNTDMPSLALRMMDGSATASEQLYYAARLIAVGERLRQRAAAVSGTLGDGVVVDGTVIEGQVVEEQAVVRSEARGTDGAEQVGSEQSLALPAHTVEPDWKP